MKKRFSKLLTTLFYMFLGSLTFILAGCYAPYMDGLVMYAPLPLEMIYCIKGKVKSSKGDDIWQAEIKAVHDVDGTVCTHTAYSNSSGDYGVYLDCFDPETDFDGDKVVTLTVSAADYETVTESVIIKQAEETSREIEKDFVLTEKEDF